MQEAKNQKEHDEEIIQTYKRRRARQLIISLSVFPVVIGVNYWVSSSLRTSIKWYHILALVAETSIVVAAVVSNLRNWRCPSCNAYLGGTFNPKFCKKCRTRLR